MLNALRIRMDLSSSATYVSAWHPSGRWTSRRIIVLKEINLLNRVECGVEINFHISNYYA